MANGLIRVFEQRPVVKVNYTALRNDILDVLKSLGAVAAFESLCKLAETGVVTDASAERFMEKYLIE